MSASHRPIHQQVSLLNVVQRILDGVIILAGLQLAIRLAHEPNAEQSTLVGLVAVLVYYLVSEAGGLYRNWRGASAQREMVSTLAAWVATVLVLILGDWATDFDGGFDRSILWQWFLATPVLLIAARLAFRIVLRSLRLHGYNTRGFAIVGMNDLGRQLAHNIDAASHLGMHFVGFYDDRDRERDGASHGVRVGTIHDLVEHARAGTVDIIYITLPMKAEERIKRTLEALSDTTASVHFAPNFFVFELLHSRWTDIGGLPVVSIFENPFYGVDGFLKRAMDVTLATILLAIVALPMAVIAMGVKLTSAGPVFFRQRRYGLDGRDIRVWKFRSMRVCENGAQVTQATQNDPRVTPFGAFLRKTSLDELPQLFNVLCGEMSLVGPRPHAAAHNEQFRKLIQGYMLRHKVKPGITGLAQVNGARGETDTLEKMQRRIAFDHQYIREWSPWNDVKILFKTLFVVLSRQNAY